MKNQKHLFRIPDGIHYLNCAYMSPLLHSVEERGIDGIRRKRDPTSITPAHFFTEAGGIREKFGKLVNCSPAQVALMPSVSYGMATVINNIPYIKGKHALTISEEFPSCYYTAKTWCKRFGADLIIISRNEELAEKTKDWNERILEAITRKTAFIIISSVHWMNGTKFDLESIGRRCRDVEAKLIVDGSQSVGALPVDVRKYQIDTLICAAYKWLMGPYSTALAYIDDSFNDGVPLEESWMTRTNAVDFSRLTEYVEDYKPGATRFDVGESSNFILVPMLNEALDQILKWDAKEIQEYGRILSQPLINFFSERGLYVEDEIHRAHHLMGLQLPENKRGGKLMEEFHKRGIYVSLRGSNIRISFNVFNTEEDVGELISALR